MTRFHKMPEHRLMVKILNDWGKALERYAYKEKELESLKSFYKICIRKKHPFAIAECKERISQLEYEMEHIMLEAHIIDDCVKKLSVEEQHFLYLKYKKHCALENIAMRMNMVRATVCRFHNSILDKMVGLYPT